MRFEIDLREFVGFRKWIKEQPRQLRLVTGNMLNNFAFDVRRQNVKIIKRTMTVRNERFVKGRLRVTKARVTAPVKKQVAYTGSVAKDRFSGWVEQEFGKKSKRNRFSTLAGRSGDKNKQMRHIIRLKPKHEVVSIDHPDYRPKGGATNIAGFFKMLERRGENRLVRVKGGYYKRKRKQFEMVQYQSDKQPKRNRWMLRSIQTYKRRSNFQAMFNREYNRVIRPPRKF